MEKIEVTAKTKLQKEKEQKEAPESEKEPQKKDQTRIIIAAIPQK